MSVPPHFWHLFTASSLYQIMPKHIMHAEEGKKYLFLDAERYAEPSLGTF